MCIGCGDFVDYCDQDECYRADLSGNARFANFYVGSTYCRHKQAQYGHENAVLDDAYGEDNVD